MQKKHFVLFFITLIFQSCFWQKPIYRFAKSTDAISIPSAQKSNQPQKCCTDFLNNCPDTTAEGIQLCKYIRVNFHFIRRSDGSGNFNKTDGTNFVLQMLSAANDRLAHNKPMALPAGNHTPVLPICLQYILAPDTTNPTDKNGIYFNDDDSIFNNFSFDDNSEFNDLVYRKFGVQKENVLNVFYIEWNKNDTMSATNPLRNKGGGVSFGSYLKVFNTFREYRFNMKINGKDTIRQQGWVAALGMNHETGHSLGLMHTWNGDDCDDTPNNPNCFGIDSLKHCYEASNNVMDYNAASDAYSPCQIGKIHWNISNLNSPQRKLMMPNWCDYHSENTCWMVRGDTVHWLAPKDLQGDIYITHHTILVVHCRVSLPSAAKIILDRDCSLIVDGGEISTTCNQPWQGIWISVKNRKHGKIILKNGGRILNCKSWNEQ